MRKIWNKGHRIRASDKHLVYHFSIGTLLFVFVAVLLLLNIKQLMRADWEHFSLFENGLTLSPYNFITILIATGVCALVAFLYYRFCYDSFKKLLHRQKLARMILENKWYEADTVQDSGFFTDLQSRSREKIVWFPKIYYQMEKGLLHIRCEITLGKYQDQLLRLEDKLESGLYCELTDKTLHDGYIEYILLYDMIANRITIDEVRAENGCLRLMKNLVWEYDALPHALIAGGTGGGKTYFLLTLIEALLHTNAVLYILDPKNADLADLGTVMENVYHTKEKMIDVISNDASSYQPGDRVVVFGELSMGMMAVLLAFIIPFCVLIISLFIFMAIWNDELLSAICSLALLIPYYYILWLNKTRMGKKFSFSIKPID